jgi:hypothetical protein
MSSTSSGKELLMVGSLPLDTAEEVMRLCGARLGRWLPCIPDGEVGDRKIWIVGLGYRVYHGHPEIETLNRPAPIDGRENWRPRDLHDIWQFRVKPGVKTVRFGDLGWRMGYARDAINSYFVFRTLREKGAIPADLRFQVCLPLTVSAFGSMFRDPDDFAKLAPGVEEALNAEVATMLRHIPAADLAIQWDCAVEIGILEGMMPWAAQAITFDFNVEPAARLSPSIPDEVMLGYHLCYGNLTDWPMIRPGDLGTCVDYTNALLQRSGRRVDFVHIPILDHVDDSYFAPLARLKLDGTRLYAGVIHHMDDLNDYRRRIAEVRKYIPAFGIAGPCGYGRLKPSVVPALIDEHVRGVEIFTRG